MIHIDIFRRENLDSQSYLALFHKKKRKMEICFKKLFAFYRDVDFQFRN